MAYDNTPKIDVIRQNQTQNARELLKSKGWIGFISVYEFMAFVELWVDYCLNGPTDSNKKRFKDFDKMINVRIQETQEEIDSIVI